MVSKKEEVLIIGGGPAGAASAMRLLTKGFQPATKLSSSNRNHEWIWMLPLSKTLTSMGLVVPIHPYKQSGLGVEKFLEQGIAGFSQPMIHSRYMQITCEAQDVIQDLLAYFWAHPWGFSNIAHHRYPEEFLGIFAGRIYETTPGEGLTHMRRAIA